MSRSLLLSLVALCLLVPLPSLGQATAEALAKCRAIDDAMERVQCYDQLAGGSIAPASEAPAPGTTTVDSKTGITLAYIPAGTFLMGSPSSEEGRGDDETQHEVTLSQPFWMGTTEVTNDQYRRFLGATGPREPAYWDDSKYNAPNQPVTGVSWDDAVAYAEGGVFTDPTGQGYDTHAEHVYGQGPNLMHLSRRLAAIINEPGEDDPAKLDLDRHFVLLNTEFGRAPMPEITPANPGGRGTNHWPWGYVVVGFGGFVDEDRAGVVGAIGENGRAISSVTPTEHRAAMLLAMGVWPFSSESFAVGDVRGAGSELEAALKLRTEILGYPV